MKTATSTDSTREQELSIKTLLIPTDFSETGTNSLAYATALAKTLKADMRLIHAYHPFVPDNDEFGVRYKDELDQFKKESDVELARICNEIKESFDGQCEFASIQGLARDVIVEQVEETKPDLLVIGTENLNPFNRIVFGTVTGKVLKEANCNFLVVPENAAYQPPQKIAFAMDYHDSDMEEIKFLAKMSSGFGSELHVIHVVSDDEFVHYRENYFDEFTKEIERTIPENRLIFELIKGDDVSDTIDKYVEENRINLLAVAKTRKNFVERLFTNSVSQKLFYHTHIPLLIFQAKDRPNDFV